MAMRTRTSNIGQPFLLKIAERIDAMSAPMEPLAGLVMDGVGGAGFGVSGGGGFGVVGRITRGDASTSGVVPRSAFHLKNHCPRWVRPTVPPFSPLVAVRISSTLAHGRAPD